MSEPFIAEIRILPYKFAPRSWATCDGQLLPISQNTALFSLIGNYYGGDGRTTVGLPNMQGRSPMHIGGNGTSSRGPGLSYHTLGEAGGEPTVTLYQSQIPQHSHLLKVSLDNPSTTDPSTNEYPSKHYGLGMVYKDVPPTAYTQMAPEALAAAGGSQAHENRQPFLALQFCIALAGLYPSRS